jgi:hypothetical protein
MNPEIDLEKHGRYLARLRDNMRAIVIVFFAIVACLSAYTYFVGW